MNKKNILIALCSIIIFSYLWTGLKNEQSAEELEIVSGFGAQEGKSASLDPIYAAPSSVYIFEEENRVDSDLRMGTGDTPAKTRESRQLTSNKQYILGLEKVYLLDEALISKRLNQTLEVFFRNPYTNDSAFVAISPIKPETILKMKVKGYPSSADYLEGLIKNSKYYNFFSSRYRISDIFLLCQSEGENLAIPQIDIVENQLEITGLYIFKKDKIAGKLSIHDAKALNMISGTKGKGLISVASDPDNHIDYYASVKRSVEVYKSDNRYKYIINLKFKGDIASNTLYHGLEEKNSVNHQVEVELEKAIKNSCKYIIDKLKHEYKVDSLNLGQYAAAKYGRNTSTDWNEVFIDADIEVNVKVQIETTGRGDYLLKE